MWTCDSCPRHVREAQLRRWAPLGVLMLAIVGAWLLVGCVGTKGPTATWWRCMRDEYGTLRHCARVVEDLHGFRERVEAR